MSKNTKKIMGSFAPDENMRIKMMVLCSWKFLISKTFKSHFHKGNLQYELAVGQTCLFV